MATLTPFTSTSTSTASMTWFWIWQLQAWLEQREDNLTTGVKLSSFVLLVLREWILSLLITAILTITRERCGALLLVLCCTTCAHTYIAAANACIGKVPVPGVVEHKLAFYFFKKSVFLSAILSYHSQHSQKRNEIPSSLTFYILGSRIQRLAEQQSIHVCTQIAERSYQRPNLHNKLQTSKPSKLQTYL